MSFPLRGYRWIIGYRGFDVYTRAYNGHTFAVMTGKTVEYVEAHGGEATQFECFDGDPYMSIVDEYWNALGL